MKSKIKLIISDVDGTLVVPGFDLPSRAVKDAVSEVQARGVAVCVVTGRPFSVVLPVIKALDLQGLCVSDGGAQIVDCTSGNTVWEQRLTAGTAQKVLDVFLPVANTVHLDGRYNVRPEEVTADDVVNGALQVWAGIPVDLVEDVLGKLRKIAGVSAHPNPAPHGDKSLCGVHVTDSGADKDHAVRKLLEFEHVPKESILAAGDADNDIPLFKNAGVKVAVGDSSPELMALADYVAPSIEQDGFVRAIERYVLLDVAHKDVSQA